MTATIRPGHGESFTDLSNGSIDGMVTVTKLEDGYIMFSIIELARDNAYRVARVSLTTDQASDLAAAIKRCTNGS